jgi:hypothetical protein
MHGTDVTGCTGYQHQNRYKEVIQPHFLLIVSEIGNIFVQISTATTTTTRFL